ncbi:MAG TPA: GNAT family N-acetyltransferase [Pirellulales bacterium]|nr:GNAT family N-acetyltransferase [Pirellulales bacterium]
MTGVRFPDGFRLTPLSSAHRRREFDCGEALVNDWLWTKALQSQEKHLSTTKVLLGPDGEITGFYTLAAGQIDFSELPAEMAKKLPRRVLPLAILAWLGVNSAHQRRGLAQRLVAQALGDCHQAGQTFAFVGVILDCVNDAAKSFYQQWDFAELPGNPHRLVLSAKALAAMMAGA